MCLDCCTLEDWGVKIVLTYSKTIQCQERRVYIALPWNKKDSRLKASDCCQASDYILSYRKSGEKCSLTYEVFTHMLKFVLTSLNLPLSEYSGHSFRLGGATHALQAGVPSEIICAQGDWQSLAYLDYIDRATETVRADCVKRMYGL